MEERKIARLLRLAEFSDSAFPVGAFSFSNGLETAADRGLVRDAASLEEYVRTMTVQAALSDGVAALCAFRSAAACDLERVLEADARVWASKPGDENRRMTQRMGRKLTELSEKLLADPFAAAWAEAVRGDRTPDCYPVAQAVLFAAAGLDEESLFASHQYGVANLILSAALRCVRVSHFDTQAILYRLGGLCDELYREARELTLDEMNLFTPEADVLAAWHEKGNMRMFMN